MPCRGREIASARAGSSSRPAARPAASRALRGDPGQRRRDGVDEETRPHLRALFPPGSERGSGLGLSLVQAFVRSGRRDHRPQRPRDGHDRRAAAAEITAPNPSPRRARQGARLASAHRPARAPRAGVVQAPCSIFHESPIASGFPGGSSRFRPRSLLSIACSLGQAPPQRPSRSSTSPCEALQGHCLHGHLDLELFDNQHARADRHVWRLRRAG